MTETSAEDIQSPHGCEWFIILFKIYPACSVPVQPTYQICTQMGMSIFIFPGGPQIALHCVIHKFIFQQESGSWATAYWPRSTFHNRYWSHHAKPFIWRCLVGDHPCLTGVQLQMMRFPNLCHWQSPLELSTAEQNFQHIFPFFPGLCVCSSSPWFLYDSAMRHAGQRQEEMAIPAEDEDITCEGLLVMWEVGDGVLPHSQRWFASKDNTVHTRA